MNPGTVLGQSIGSCILLVGLAILGKPQLALGIATAGGLWALVLNVSYAHRLGSQGRSQRRATGDRSIARQLLVSYGMPISIAILVLLTGVDEGTHVSVLTEPEVQALLAVLAATVVAWLMSSHVDWYYIRPLIDGVVEAPPCVTSRANRWKGVTRKWYIHRATAAIATMVAVAGIAFVITEMLRREDPGMLAEVGGFATILGLGYLLMKDDIRSAGPTSRGIQSPRYWVGDDLSYETDMWKHRGYVLHISVPVTKLIPLDFRTGQRDDRFDFAEEPATRLFEARCRSQAFAGCVDGCSMVNRECVHDQPRTGIGKRHWIVI